MDRTVLLVISVSLCCFLGSIYSQDRYGCQKKDCEKIKCPELENCDNGRFIRNGSLYCGCCHTCVKYLEAGAPCQTQVHSTLPRQECGEGLRCKNSICSDIPTKCVQEQIQFNSEKMRTEGFTMGKPKPMCDTFGDYQPVQCKEEMKCYCVDVNGRRIFGLAAPTKEQIENMNCTCARDYEDFKKHLKDPNEPNQFMRCASDGDYYHTQCTDEKCYCVNAIGELIKRAVAKAEIGTLQCSEEVLNDYATPCIKEYNDTMNRIKGFDGLVIGIDPPSCDLDGSYAPVQCRGFECYCVNREGLRSAQGRSILRNSKEAQDMKCSCVREKALLKELETSTVVDILTRYKCSNNGNYLPVQCTNANCFCVDPVEGFQTSPVVLLIYRGNLPCYRVEYEDLLDITWE